MDDFLEKLTDRKAKVLLDSKNPLTHFFCHFVASYFIALIYRGVKGIEMSVGKNEMKKFTPAFFEILRGVMQENKIDQLAFIAPHDGSVRMVDFRGTSAENGFRSFLLHPDVQVVYKQMPLVTNQRVLPICDVSGDGTNILQAILIARQYKNKVNQVLVMHDENRGLAFHLGRHDVELLALTDRELFLQQGIEYPFPGELSRLVFDSARSAIPHPSLTV